MRAVIETEKGNVLLLRRDNTDSSEGEWCLPGGKIDLGQTAEEAMIREVKEKIDLVCEEVDFLFYQDNPPTPQLPDHFKDKTALPKEFFSLYVLPSSLFLLMSIIYCIFIFGL